MILFRFSREILVISAVLIGLVYVGAYFLSSGATGAKISDLAGRWKGNYSDYAIALEIDRNHGCTLIISGDKKGKQFFSGKCAIDRKKAPTALSILNLPAYDFNLHTIFVRMDDKSLLMAPFAKRKRARPITFSKSFIMVKQ